MLNTDILIRQWRASLVDLSEQQIDELEDHLREQIDRFAHSSLSDEERFTVAAMRCGQTKQIVDEYANASRLECVWGRVLADRLGDTTTLSVPKPFTYARVALNIVGALPIIVGFIAWFLGVMLMGNRDQVATIILPFLGASAAVAISSALTLQWKPYLHLGFSLIFFTLLTILMLVNIISELLHKGHYGGWHYPLMFLFMLVGIAGLAVEIKAYSLRRVV